MENNTQNKGLSRNDGNTMLDDVKIKAKIDKNRDEINYWLNGDYPLDVVYMRIRMLSSQNERLIKQLKGD